MRDPGLDGPVQVPVATWQYFGWPELVAVTGLASAQRAIDEILEQGEGPRGHWRDAARCPGAELTLFEWAGGLPALARMTRMTRDP